MLGFLTYFLIIFTPLASLFIYDYYNGYDHELFDPLMGLMVFSAMTSIMLMGVVSIIDGSDGIDNYKEKTEIFSMYNSSNMSGGVFLLVGSMDEDQYYTYLKKNEHGNYIKKRIEEHYDGSVEINTYSDTTLNDPMIIRHKEVEYNEGFWTFDYRNERTLRTVIQIPEGSLKREIKIK